MKNWYVVTPDGKEIMMPEDELLAGVSSGALLSPRLIPAFSAFQSVQLSWLLITRLLALCCWLNKKIKITNTP